MGASAGGVCASGTYTGCCAVTTGGESMPMVLDGVRVLDLSSGPVGGVATMILGDFGAEVVKLERPGGDPLRSLTAAPMWLRGKRSVEVDLTTERGRARLLELSAEADVALTTFRPSTVARLGADYQTLVAGNPGLIYCSITGFGPEGPYADYPAYEGLVAAKSGRMQGFTGQRLREGPGFAAVPVGGHGASQGAVQGIVAALIERDRCGRGQIVETSLLQGMLPFDLVQLLLTQLHERQPEVYPDILVIGGGMPTLNYHPVMTADGQWIQLGNLLEHLFYAFMDAAGLTELFVEEQWQGGQAEWSEQAVEEMRDRILTRMQEHSAEEWMEIFRASGNVAAEIFTPTHDAVANGEMHANGDVVTIEDPQVGPVRQLGPIAHMRETPAEITTPAPPVGEANGFSWPSRNGSTSTSANGLVPSGRPLEGFTILEFATIIATPIGVSMLADLGARVIKVEPIGGDPFRGMGAGPLTGLLAAKTKRCQGKHLHRPQERFGAGDRGRADRPGQRDRAQLPSRRPGPAGHWLGTGQRDPARHRLGLGERLRARRAGGEPPIGAPDSRRGDRWGAVPGGGGDAAGGR